MSSLIALITLVLFAVLTIAAPLVPEQEFHIVHQEQEWPLAEFSGLPTTSFRHYSLSFNIVIHPRANSLISHPAGDRRALARRSQNPPGTLGMDRSRDTQNALPDSDIDLRAFMWDQEPSQSLMAYALSHPHVFAGVPVLAHLPPPVSDSLAGLREECVSDAHAAAAHFGLLRDPLYFVRGRETDAGSRLLSWVAQYRESLAQSAHPGLYRFSEGTRTRRCFTKFYREVLTKAAYSPRRR